MALTTNPSPSKPKLVKEGNEKWRKIKKKSNVIIQKEIQILLNTLIPLQAIGVKYEIRPNASA
ncbi:927_t:CDS:2 [Gigaspora rosea]|nr:927_t:CDS:2 [Gigaspora rosea]